MLAIAREEGTYGPYCRLGMAIEAALASLSIGDVSAARVARIRDTLHLDEIWLSAPLLAELARLATAQEVRELDGTTASGKDSALRGWFAGVRKAADPAAFSAAGDELHVVPADARVVERRQRRVDPVLVEGSPPLPPLVHADAEDGYGFRGHDATGFQR